MTIRITKVAFKSWEEEVLKLWTARSLVEACKWGTRTINPKASFIRGYLAEHSEGYAKELWQAWSSFVDRAKDMGVLFKRGSYAEMWVYLLLLWKRGLVQLVRRGSYPPKHPLRKGYFEPNYYALNPTHLGDLPWRKRAIDTFLKETTNTVQQKLTHYTSKE